jgi:spermidine/putrescine transport system substrate-binding protein
MTTFLRCVITAASLFWAGTTFSSDNTLNIFTWAGEIPRPIILQFEKETGIKVTHTTFDSNEMMFTKLRATKNTGYDLVEPSSYYIDRMHRQGLLEKLDKTKHTN